MTYQQAPSYDAREEPHEVAEVVFRGIPCFPIGKVKQNISYNTEDGKPHQRMSDASCAFAVAHGGGRESVRFSPPSLCLQLRYTKSVESVPVGGESKSNFPAHSCYLLNTASS